MKLLQSGVTAPVIALWLGHEDTATTHQYIEANLLSARVTPCGQMSHQLLDLRRQGAGGLFLLVVLTMPKLNRYSASH
jgi:hypothetical protein